MLVSIITPSYNAEKFIALTIDSVLAQTYPTWEMIIVDDHSNDKTVEIIKRYTKKDKRIKLISLTKQHGPALARNKAIASAQGKYIAFLDADDLWVPQKLEKQLDFIQKNHLAFSYASYYLINDKGEDIGQFKTKSNITYHSMLQTCSVGCLTAIYDTEILGKYYMLDYRKGEDLMLWLNIMKRIKKTQGILEPLAYYRIHENSISTNKFKALKAQWHIYRHIERLSIKQSIYYLFHYTYFGFTKYR